MKISITVHDKIYTRIDYHKPAMPSRKFSRERIKYLLNKLTLVPSSQALKMSLTAIKGLYPVKLFPIIKVAATLAKVLGNF